MLRKNIIKGLKYAYINISSASDVIDLIITHALSSTSINELSHFYLINDILFNSTNTSIQHAWIYHDIIKDKIPFLFHMKFHNKNIYGKLGVSSRKQLVEIARSLEKRGLL